VTGEMWVVTSRCFNRNLRVPRIEELQGQEGLAIALNGNASYAS